GEVVDMHAPREVILHEGEPVGKGEGELADRVGPCLGDVVAADGHRVVVANLLFDEVLLDVPHHLQGEFSGEDTGVLPLVLLEYIRLHGPADCLQCAVADLFVLGVSGSSAVFLDEYVHLLVDCRIEEERQHHRGRAVDRDGDAGIGSTEIKPGKKLFHVVYGADGNTALSHLPVDVGRIVGVLAIEGDAVKGRGQAFGIIILAEVVKTAVGPLRSPFAGKLALWVLFGPLEREDPGSEGEESRCVLQHAPAEDLAPVGKIGDTDLGDPGSGKGCG